MIHAQTAKNVVVLAMGTIATNATTSGRFDRLNYDYAQVSVAMQKATATDSSAKFTVLKLLHSDTTTFPSTSTNAISGFIGTTNTVGVTTVGSQEFVIPAHNDSTNDGVVRMNVDLKSLKRYIFVQVQANASHQTVRCDVNLYRGRIAPVSATDSGVEAVVNGPLA